MYCTTYQLHLRLIISIVYYLFIGALQSLPETISANDVDSDEMQPFNDRPNIIIKGK